MYDYSGGGSVPTIKTITKDPLTAYLATLQKTTSALKTSIATANTMAAESKAASAAAATIKADIATNYPSVIKTGTTGGTTTTTSDVNPYTGLSASTSTELTKAILLSKGLPSSMISASTDFLNALMKENLSPADAVDIFLNSPSYTTKSGQKLTSVFYENYGKYNDTLKTKLAPSDLFNTIEGYRATQAKYNLDAKFTSPDSIQNLLQNNVSVATFDERANAARLKAVTNDPFYTQSLKDLGYISGSQDLTDFYMDPKIGAEALQQKRNTAAFTTEALRQAKGTGIQIQNDYMTKTAAELTNLGYSEAQIANIAQQGYQNIAANLEPTTTLAGIYQTPTSTPQTYKGTNDAYNLGIQQELQAQEFQGLASKRRKTLAEQEAAAFQGSPGLSGTSAYLRKTSLTKGTLGQL